METTTALPTTVLAWLRRRRDNHTLPASRIAAGVGVGTELVRVALDLLAERQEVVFDGNGARRRFRARRDGDLLSVTTERLAAQHTLDVVDLYTYGHDFDDEAHDLAWEELQRRGRDGDEDALDFLGDSLEDE